MARAIDRYFIPLVVGLAPVLLMLLTWAPDGRLTPGMMTIRSQVFPIVLAELFVVLVALRAGLLPALRRFRLPVHVIAAGAILLLVMIGTAVYAPDPVTARFRTFYWIIHLLFGLSVMHLCERAFAAQNLVAAYVAGFVLFAALLAWFVTRIEAPAAFDWTFGLPAAGHIRHYGYYAAAVAALCVGSIAVTDRRGAWIGAWAAATLAFVLALWTGSRGAVVAASGAILLGLLLVPPLRAVKVWGGAASALAAAAFVAWRLPAPAENMGLGRTVAAMGAESVTTGRTDLWRQAIEAILQRPVFGYGEGQMATVAPFYTMVHPHNALLQFLLAWGVVGTICLAILGLAFALFAGARVRAAGGWLVPPFLAMLTLLLFAAFDGTLYHGLPLSLFAACAGLVAGSRAEAGEGS